MTPPPPLRAAELWQRFWFQGQEQEQLLARPFRALLFTLLAYDAWSQISHLSRYGAGGFNVSHFPTLDAALPAPKASWMLGLVILQVVLSLCVALGLHLRRSLPALAVVYGAAYFWSQLDSYQHHYMVAVLIAMLAGAVWVAPTDAPARQELPGWSLRLVRAQIAILYLWTSVTKAEPQWLSGAVMEPLLTEDWARDLVTKLAQLQGAPELTAYSQLSWMVLVLELSLVVGVLWPERLRWPTLALGLSLHLGIEAAGFRIGNFSYIMVALYVLMLPPRCFAHLPRLQSSLKPYWAPIGSIFLGCVVAFALPLEGALGVGVLCAAVALWVSFRARLSLPSLAPLVAGLALVTLHLGTDQLRDYYRYMGGDARARSDWELATFAYEQAVEIDPQYFSGAVRLGDLYKRAGRVEDARAMYEAASRIEPNNPTATERALSLPPP